MFEPITKALAKDIVEGNAKYQIVNTGTLKVDDYTFGFAKGLLHGLMLAEPLQAALETLAFDCQHEKTKAQAKKVLAYWNEVNGCQKSDNE